ncbi:MAG: PAS domain-containing protein, partial [Chloroflexales bacterium]|nr:PAS domain-containing protein [Chloroflexales bacterium]
MQNPLCADMLHLQLLTQALPVILMEWNHTGIVTSIQGRGLHHLGITPGQVLGRSVFELVQHDADIQEHIRNALAGEAFTAIVTFRDRIFETYYRPIRQSLDQELRVVSIALDITERTLLGEHLLQCLAKAPHGNLPLRNDGDPVEAACARL